MARADKIGMAFHGGGTRRKGRGLMGAETRRGRCSACTTDIFVMIYQDTTNIVVTDSRELILMSSETEKRGPRREVENKTPRPPVLPPASL